MKKTVLFLSLIFTAVLSFGQSYDKRVAAYIEKFRDVAVAEQLRCGIPASITLAQGILETAAGTSELCVNAQNHFGIKCKSTWRGMTYAYTDDAKDECFRKYEDAQTSYKDHSDFLKYNKRYATLFQYAVEDYISWAKGLKKCGYATNPHYATKLIETIEKYDLQQYTNLALTYPSLSEHTQPVLASAKQSDVAETYFPAETASTTTDKAPGVYDPVPGKPDQTGYYETTTRNGLKGFYAPKGDLLLEYAIKHRIRYSRLLELNDLFDQPLESDMFIYLEKKKKTGPEETYVVQPGETLLIIAQSAGMQLESLRNLNHIAPGQEPEPGSTLYLQYTSPADPNTYIAGADKVRKPIMPVTATTPTDLIPTRKEEPAFLTDIIEPENTVPERYNIADEQSIEEERSSISAGNAAPEVNELDQLKARFDKSVYTTPSASTTTHDINANTYEAVPANHHTDSEEDNDIVVDADAALRSHMQAMKSSKTSEFTPKSNGDKTIKANNSVAKNITPPKKAPPANTTAAKKPTTTTKKPTATKKPTTQKPGTAVKKTSSSNSKPNGSRPAPKKK